MIRFFLMAGMISSALLLAPQQIKAEEFTPAQKEEIKKLFDAYLAESGESVLASVNTYHAKLQEEDAKKSKERAKVFEEQLKNQKDLTIGGNPDGDVTIVEFFDYNCGYCRKALEEIQKVLKDDKNIKLVFIDMPILGPSSVEAAKWSLASQKQGKYFEYHQAIMNFDGPKNAEELEKLAKKVGLDVEKLKKDKDSAEISARVDANLKNAQDLGIRGTPGFIVGGELYPGFVPADEMKKQIATARKK